jgi:curli biogenesis system outer membrane secretion channel CsgG
MLITALFKTKKYRIYERNKLKSIMKEQNLQMSGAVDMSTAVQIGKLVGAKYIVTGAVTEFGVAKSGAQGGGYFSVGKQWYRSTVDVRAVSVQTGEIVFADSGSGALKSRAVTVLGIGGGESYDEKKATESMRMAIEDVMSATKCRIRVTACALMRLFYFSAICQTTIYPRDKVKTQSDMGCWGIGEIEILDQNDQGFSFHVSFS